MKFFPKSLRWKIQIWHGTLLSCIVAALVIGFYQYERHSRFKEVDAKLFEYISPALPELAPGGPPEGGRRRGGPREFDDFRESPTPPERHRGGLARLESAGLYYLVWDRNDTISRSSANAPDGIPLPEISPGPGHQIRTRGEFRELLHFVPNGSRVLIGVSTATIRRDLSQLAFWLTLAGVGVVAIGFAGGWWMTGRAIQPIAEISSAGETIANGDLSKRIPISDPQTELGQLALVLNNTFERLEKSFDQQVQFTADASHELRTPISVMLTQVQLALSRERTPEEYQQTLQTCERAVERMRELVNQLLELARVDSGEFELMREECDLGRVVRESLEFIAPLARNKNVRITQSLETVRARIDTMRMGQVMINLLSNAVHHNPTGIEICISLKQKGSKAMIRVADNGNGIPSEALPHIFERFYRADKSRARAKGSSGLGLAISKAIIEAHSGTITVESAQGHGTSFEIELPVDISGTRKTWTRLPRSHTGK